MTDQLQLHRQVMETSRELVLDATPEQLVLSTPCQGWNLADLLAHMTGQNYGFALASSGDDTTTDHFRPRPITDPGHDYGNSVDNVLAAFAEEGALEREWHLAEFGPARFPGHQALGFHLIDYVAHSWDVASSLGKEVEFDDQVIEAATLIAAAVPDDESRLRPGSPFAPAIPAGSEDPFHRILAHLGRDPAWKPGAG